MRLRPDRAPPLGPFLFLALLVLAAACGSGGDRASGAGPVNGGPPGADAATPGNGGRSVLLQWTASTTPGVTYDAYRSDGCTGMYAVQASGITTTSWTDTAVTNGQTYCYVTTAVDSSGQSGDSNTAMAVIP